MKAILALEDGTVFEGEHFGAEGEKCGEVVFNTSMTGYQEVLTDPSYKGQIVTMTYPLIGNYGCNWVDLESQKPHVEGFVVREYTSRYSNWRANESLSNFLQKHGVVGIQKVDTRALTRHLRTRGVMKGIVSTIDLNRESLTQKVKDSPGLIGRDLVKEVSCNNQYVWKESVESEFSGRASSSSNDSQLSFHFQFKPSPAKHSPSKRRFKVVALDYGIKQNILKKLNAHGCDVIVLPCQATAKEILALEPDGIFLSNGPGDPEGVPYVIETVRELIVTKKPIFGICLGHQILGLAFGGRTFKLKFGHRGANQPVLNLETEKVEITAQNHGFCVDMDSLKGKGLILTHINLNDKTCEGMKHEELPIFSVQYHPEASPGPHDADYLFDEFTKMMER